LGGHWGGGQALLGGGRATWIKPHRFVHTAGGCGEESIGQDAASLGKKTYTRATGQGEVICPFRKGGFPKTLGIFHTNPQVFSGGAPFRMFLIGLFTGGGRIRLGEKFGGKPNMGGIKTQKKKWGGCGWAKLLPIQEKVPFKNEWEGGRVLSGKMGDGVGGGWVWVTSGGVSVD